MAVSRWRLLPLFLISLAAVGYEIALTRYFAVAKWSEYGYWVISIVMVGFALSGVMLALARDWFARHGRALQSLLPAALIAAATAGYHLTTTNPFNPLQMQNAVTLLPQLANIAAYYAVLLPFFFLTGVYVSLAFVLNDREVGRVYGYDLTGAGAGGAVVLGLMAFVHPFQLVPFLLVPLALSAFGAPRWRPLAVVAAFAVLAGGEALLLLDDEAAFNDFKAIYAPLNTPDARIVAQYPSPHGLYQLLDDFTERVDTDVSNNSGMLGLPGPPTTLGLYRDGNRLAALPKPGGIDADYAPATLAALPYTLIERPRVLLIGTSGGFRIAEALKLGAAQIDAVEPEPMLARALRSGLGPSPAAAADPRVRLLAESPIAAARAAGTSRGGNYDIIDIAGDFVDQSETNAHAFTVEAIRDDLAALRAGGLLSIPVSIRDLPVYATRMLATIREAMRGSAYGDPARNIIVYRSAWSARILVGRAPLSPARIEAARKFCDERSFDVSYYPGIDVAAARANIYNDLPAVSFATGEVTSSGPADAIADEAAPVLRGASTEQQAAFNLGPITFNRPFYYAVLNLGHLDTILKRIEVLPQAEIGQLVNLAVLAQAILLATLVVLLPLAAPRRLAGAPGQALRSIIYFPALGLGFLFIEIFMIERASFYLNDRVTAFALVITTMLVFSGIGSMMSARFTGAPWRGLAIAALAILVWCAFVMAGLHSLLLETLDWSLPARAAILLVLIAPVSIALGMPFPLGLDRAASMGSGGFLPWAWGLNGAFSVVATPLANLIALTQGFDWVLLAAALMYVLAVVFFPSARRSLAWRTTSVI